MPPAVQVSFQGGGAFLALMIPIAHALSDAKAKGYIEVAGVAGSSAGSVAAALLATSADFEALRAYCKKSLATDAKKTAGRYYYGLGRFGQLWAMRKVWRGHDLISDQKLNMFFSNLFRAAGVELIVNDAPVEISQVKDHSGIELIVTRSSLDKAGLDLRRSGPLIETLVDSCAVPFAIRNFRSAQKVRFVDGGLCENLPIVGFDLTSSTPILAVSIDDGSTLSKSFGIWDFALRLFTTSINHNVNRSKDIVGSAMMIEERSPFAFHHISKAVDWISNDENYQKVYQRAWRKFLDLSSYYSSQTDRGIFLTGRDTIKLRDNQLAELLSDLHVHEDFHVEQVELRVNAECLQNPDPGSYRKMDIITSTAKIRVLRSGARFYKSYVPLQHGRFQPATFVVTNSRTGTHPKFSVFHYHDDQDGGDDYDPCFLRFETPDTDLQSGDLLHVECVYPISPSMVDLAEKRVDFLGLRNGHSRAVPLEITLVYPRSLGAVAFELRAKNGHVVHQFEEIQQGELSSRLGPGALNLRIAGVKSVKEVPPQEWLSVWATLLTR